MLCKHIVKEHFTGVVGPDLHRETVPQKKLPLEAVLLAVDATQHRNPTKP
jgi:hypothetical protein